ncbi:DUF2510 domain-containing protein [Mycobacterium sp. C31M]
MDLKRTSTRVGLACGLLFVIGVVARIIGPLLGPASYVGRDLVIFGPALAILGAVGVSISLLVSISTGSVNNQSTIVAGWYPDHQNPELIRYFDGKSWTQHTAPRHADP